MAYYAEKDFFADDRLIELVTDILNGNLTLEWFEVETAEAAAEEYEQMAREQAAGS